ncbi:DNA-binding protein [Microbulbifer sp. THAF38]|uniref:DNA-binding protein n=1 Tax=Microbulbifer sp. THAF38 TaxID=2587856 RepID=UPI001268B566|nr:DNA-binding protein [Microbulbifer sp. THAF38]QFT54915.1 chromosome segregation protein [Microbulbifer sp. THAF38]
MARTGVTYLDIVQAAKAIKVRGEEPTVDRVRAQLGTGSKSTIAPLLKRWRSESASDTDVNGLPKDLVDALKELHQRIQGAANKQIEEVQQEFQVQEKEITSQLEESRSTTSQQAARIRELEQKLSITETEKRKLKQSLEETRGALEKSDYQRQEALGRIAEQKAAIEEIKQENRDVREHFEHFQQRTANDRQHERDQFRASSEQMKGQIAVLNEQLALSERRFNEQELLYKQGQALIVELNREKQQLSEQVGVASTEAANLRQQAEMQGGELKDKQAEIASLHERVSQLQSESSATRREVHLQQSALEKLESELAASQNRLEQVTDENRILIQEKAMIQGQFTQLESSLKS